MTDGASGVEAAVGEVAGLASDDPGRGALLVHGHLDVVPADPAEWSVHPFSGEVRDGYLWGRGAVDMKDMVAMTLAVARAFRRDGVVPRTTCGGSSGPGSSWSETRCRRSRRPSTAGW